MKHPGNKKIIEVLEKTGGLIKPAAKNMRISRQCLYDWIKASTELQAAVNDCRESSIDLAESKLIKKIEKGDVISIIFFLKTQGKSRGYVEKTETETTSKHTIDWDNSPNSKKDFQEILGDTD